MIVTLNKKQARQFLLHKQLLNPPKSLDGLAGIETVLNSLRIIQYDPLNPCGRNPDLVLQSRVANIHPDDYHHWLYTEHKGIEVYDKELCIIPTEDIPYTIHRNQSAINSKSKAAFLLKYRQELNEIITRIKNEGPITSSDLKTKHRVVSGWGSEALFGRMALEALWKIGKIVVVKREGMKKYYDLSNRVLSMSDSTFGENITEQHIIRRINSVGMLPKSTVGGGWQGMGSGTAKLINKLLKQQKIIECTIKDSKKTYLILEKDLEILESGSLKKPNQMVFIAPLDNLIWDRGMIEDLFDFHYRWEVYTPKVKRKFGYYVLPILYGDAFIGRIEPIKKGNDLEVKGLWLERKWNSDEIKSFERALRSFSQYLKTESIINPFNP